MKKQFMFLISGMLFLILTAELVAAHCPLCTAATGAAVVATRQSGLDDMITGLFIGAFAISTALWFNNIILKKRNGKQFLPYQATFFILVSVILTFLTFHWANILTNYFDRLGQGTLIGSVITLASFHSSKAITKVRGKTIIPFQTIILTLIALGLTGLLISLFH